MKPAQSIARYFPYALLVAVAGAVTLPLFRAAGLPYNVDISGFFPLTTDAFVARFWPLWNERGGIGTAQFLPALLVELPILLAGQVFGWGMDVHIKFRIFLGFALSGMAMYSLARYHLETRYAARLGLWARIVLPLAPALLYMLNPWSVHRAFHYFLWLGYGFAPLVLLAFLWLADAPSWRRGVVLGLVAIIGTTDPHNPPLFALVVAPFALLRFGQALRASRAHAATLGRGVVAAASVYLAVGAFWILPYVWSAISDPGFGPTYVLSDEMLGVLSRNAGLGDVLRLTHNYAPRAPLSPIDGPALAAWNVASLVVPVLALLALFMARRPIVWAYGALGSGAIVLGLGASGATGGMYHWIVFEAPWGEGLSWLFRDPYRWGGIQALAYSVLLVFALAEAAIIVQRAPRRFHHGIAAGGPSFMVAVIALFVAPALTGYVGAVYAPVEIPSEYAEANAFLASTPEDEGVVWMPRTLGATTWSGDRTLAYFDATSSSRAALGPFRPHTSLYFRFIEDANKDGADVPALLARAGVSRVVFHNDRVPERDASVVESLVQTGLVREARVGSTPVVAVDQASIAPANTPAARYVLNGTRELSQTFTPTLRDPLALMIRARAVGDPAPLEVRLVDAEGTLVAFRRALGPSAPGEVTVSLRGVALAVGRPYAVQLSAPGDSVNASARWEVSYYKLDGYPGGNLTVSSDGSAWKALEGDLAFELRSQAKGFVEVLRSPLDAPRVFASDRVVASPGSLLTMRVLSTLPAESGLRDAPVVFTGANGPSRAALSQDANWTWIAPLEAGPWEAIVPFLAADRFIAPFEATTSADGKTGWARGTEDFTYDEWGWRTSLAALKQEAWDFDGDRGLVYTSAPADLTLDVAPSAAVKNATVLVRVYEHPLGGTLRIHAGEGEDASLVAAIKTRAPVAGFRWREVGQFPEGASTLRLEGDGSFLGVNLVAVVPPVEVTWARGLSDRRFLDTPVGLVAQAEVTPGLAARTVTLPGVGRFAELGESAVLPFHTPRGGAHEILFRIANGTPAPLVTVDGKTVPRATCVADCDGAAAWHAVPLGSIATGAHEIGLSSPLGTARPMIDVLMIATSDAAITAVERAPAVEWGRISATEYRVTLEAGGPVALVLGVPYDAGWVARLEGSDPVRSKLANGVVNVFTLDAHDATTVTISYAPQEWATGGAFISGLALAAACALIMISVVTHVRARRTSQCRAVGGGR